jgi:hypothetical protein
MKSLFELSVEAGMDGDTFTHQVMEAYCSMICLAMEDNVIKKFEIHFGDKLVVTTVEDATLEGEVIQ